MVTPDTQPLPPSEANDLRRRLAQDDVTARQTALARLIEQPRPEFQDDLAARLDDHDPDVVQLATIALAQLEPIPETDLLRALQPHRPLAVRHSAAGGFARAGAGRPEALEKLRECLDDDDLTLCELAALALSRSGAPAVALLESAAESSRPETQRWALAALGRMGPPARSSLPCVERLLATELPRLRLAAAVAVANMTDENDEALSLLLEAARSPDAGVRELAADHLGQLGSPHEPAVQCLIGMLQDGEAAVVGQAALALGRIRSRDAKVRAALEDVLRHEDLQVRRHGLMALASWGAKARDASPAMEPLLLDQREDVAVLAAAALEKLSSSA
jgi:HEAT repeat protein